MITIDNTAQNLSDNESSESTNITPRRRRRSSTLQLLYNPADIADDAANMPADDQSNSAPSSSSTITILIPDARSTRSDRAATRKAIKVERTTQRAKNRTGKDITNEDIQRWEAALHPNRSKIVLRDNEFILNALAYNSQFTKHSGHDAAAPRGEWTGNEQRSTKDPKPAKDAMPSKDERTSPTTNPLPPSTPVVDILPIHPLLASLGIDGSMPRYASKDGRVLLSKLKEKLGEHLGVTAFEDAETKKRMWGFFRYVNRCTYDSLVEKEELDREKGIGVEWEERRGRE